MERKYELPSTALSVEVKKSNQAQASLGLSMFLPLTENEIRLRLTGQNDELISRIISVENELNAIRLHLENMISRLEGTSTSSESDDDLYAGISSYMRLFAAKYHPDRRLIESLTDGDAKNFFLDRMRAAIAYYNSLNRETFLKKNLTVDEVKSYIIPIIQDIAKVQNRFCKKNIDYLQKEMSAAGVGDKTEIQKKIAESEKILQSNGTKLDEVELLSNRLALHDLRDLITFLTKFYAKKLEWESSVNEDLKFDSVLSNFLENMIPKLLDYSSLVVRRMTIEGIDEVPESSRDIAFLLFDIIKKRALLSLRLNSFICSKTSLTKTILFRQLHEADELLNELDVLERSLQEKIAMIGTDADDISTKLSLLFAGEELSGDVIQDLISDYLDTSTAHFYNSPSVTWSELTRFVLHPESTSSGISSEMDGNTYISTRLSLLEEYELFLEYKNDRLFYAQVILKKVEALNRDFSSASNLEDKFKCFDEITKWQQIISGKNKDRESEIIPKELDKFFKDGVIDKTEIEVVNSVRQAIADIASSVHDQIEFALDGQGEDCMLSIPALYASDLTHQTSFGSGACELLGERENQEDALMVRKLNNARDLHQLPSKQLGYRLWTALKVLDEQITQDNSLDHQGATASTTIIRGDDIITATIGDSVAFAVVYDEAGHAYVQRLNRRLHAPDDEKELERLYLNQTPPVRVTEKGETFDMSVTTDEILDTTEVRLPSGINMSRSIGDKSSREHGAISDPDIDITSISELKKSAKSKTGFIGSVMKIQIITTCDGFTQIADRVSKSKRHSSQDHKQLQEDLLEHCLNKTKDTDLTESDLAKQCAEFVLKDLYVEKFRMNKRGQVTHSTDNVSVAVQTIPTEQAPEELFSCMMGVFDGHGGHRVARILAQRVGDEFVKQCDYTPGAYAKQSLSVQNNLVAFQRDNPSLMVPESLEVVTQDKMLLVEPIVSMVIVSDSKKKNQERKVSFSENAVIETIIKSFKDKTDLDVQKNITQETNDDLRHKLQIWFDLNKYIKRIESYNGDYKRGFKLFSESRAINRNVNYLLAQSLRDALTSETQDLNVLFNETRIKKRRHSIAIDIPGALKYEYRGINSTELNDIIKNATADYLHNNKQKP